MKTVLKLNSARHKAGWPLAVEYNADLPDMGQCLVGVDIEGDIAMLTRSQWLGVWANGYSEDALSFLSARPAYLIKVSLSGTSDIGVYDILDVLPVTLTSISSFAGPDQYTVSVVAQGHESNFEWVEPTLGMFLSIPTWNPDPLQDVTTIVDVYGNITFTGSISPSGATAPVLNGSKFAIMAAQRTSCRGYERAIWPAAPMTDPHSTMMMWLDSATFLGEPLLVFQFKWDAGSQEECLVVLVAEESK